MHSPNEGKYEVTKTTTYDWVDEPGSAEGGRRRRMRGRMRERNGPIHGGRGHWESHRRGGRMRRGEIRTALLAVLAEAPGHGYEVMQRLEEKSGGAWRPSPGSVYPTLQLLEDEGLVRSTERDGKRIYELSDEGRAEATRRTEEAGGDPFAADRVASVYGQLRENGMSLLQAIRQIARTGNEAQVQQASEIVRDARKQLYRLLADD
jgi:DNA-binding PadR family transcriptional regulator